MIDRMKVKMKRDEIKTSPTFDNKLELASKHEKINHGETFPEIFHNAMNKMESIKKGNTLTESLYGKEDHPRMILNPDRSVVANVINRIYMCGGYCPSQPRDTDTDTRCPCTDFIDKGICYCKLYVPEFEGMK